MDFLVALLYPLLLVAGFGAGIGLLIGGLIGYVAAITHKSTEVLFKAIESAILWALIVSTGGEAIIHLPYLLFAFTYEGDHAAWVVFPALIAWLSVVVFGGIAAATIGALVGVSNWLR